MAKAIGTTTTPQPVTASLTSMTSMEKCAWALPLIAGIGLAIGAYFLCQGSSINAGYCASGAILIEALISLPLLVQLDNRNALKTFYQCLTPFVLTLITSLSILHCLLHYEALGLTQSEATLFSLSLASLSLLPCLNYLCQKIGAPHEPDKKIAWGWLQPLGLLASCIFLANISAKYLPLTSLDPSLIDSTYLTLNAIGVASFVASLLKNLIKSSWKGNHEKIRKLITFKSDTFETPEYAEHLFFMSLTKEGLTRFKKIKIFEEEKRAIYSWFVPLLLCLIGYLGLAYSKLDIPSAYLLGGLTIFTLSYWFFLYRSCKTSSEILKNLIDKKS